MEIGIDSFAAIFPDPATGNGAIIGGIGISGASWAQDQEAGEEALRNFVK